MYFDKNRKIDINKIINRDFEIYAHTKDNRREILEEHLDLSLKYFLELTDKKNLSNMFEEIEKIFFPDKETHAIKLFREMILNTIYLHDVGKINPYFQKIKLENDLSIDISEKFKNSKHSLLSSIIYVDYYLKKIKKEKKNLQLVLTDFMILNSHIISRHHNGLNSWDDYKKKFFQDGEGEKLLGEQKLMYERLLKIEMKISVIKINKIIKIIEEKNKKATKEEIISRYIYERFLLSLLIACDYYSTTEFMDGVEINDFGLIDSANEFHNSYKEGKIYKSIRKYEKNSYKTKKNLKNIKDINILRNELFLDAEKKLEANYENNIFYLEAPTGSGKSNVATNLCYKLLEKDKSKNKIFYVYPFNTLVEQNINTLKKVYEKEQNILSKIAVINSIEPIKNDIKNNLSEDTKNEYYKKALLDRQFLNYPIVLTTHVSVFKFLFGTYREDLFPLYQLSNSIIVLDEIQSYKNLIWGEIITFLSSYSKILNFKVIIMSATLPDLEELTLTKSKTVKLIDNRRKYYNNSIFKDRVKIDYSLLEKTNDIELYLHVKNSIGLKKKILIEFIKKKSAYDFYHKVKNDDEVNVTTELMTGDDNIGERDRIIKRVNESGSLLLVATQVVEAGVDIDMDIGYKNISTLDSEEQFLGRINRSCKKDNSIVYFFKSDEAKEIYKGDVRINKDVTIENKEMRKILVEKNFDKYYGIIIERLKYITNQINELNIETFFSNEVRNLKFETVEKKLELINKKNNKISIFLNGKTKIKDELLNGYELWMQYKKLLTNKKTDYSKKRVQLSIIKSKMNNFIYEVKWSYDFPYNDRLGDLYFIEDGYKYLKEGKLDKEKFESGIGDFI